MATNRKHLHPQQLELRVFGDISSHNKPAGGNAPKTSATKTSPSKPHELVGEATERDKAIYSSIADRYFEL